MSFSARNDRRSPGDACVGSIVSAGKPRSSGSVYVGAHRSDAIIVSRGVTRSGVSAPPKLAARTLSQSDRVSRVGSGKKRESPILYRPPSTRTDPTCISRHQCTARVRHKEGRGIVVVHLRHRGVQRRVAGCSARRSDVEHDHGAVRRSQVFKVNVARALLQHSRAVLLFHSERPTGAEGNVLIGDGVEVATVKEVARRGRHGVSSSRGSFVAATSIPLPRSLINRLVRAETRALPGAPVPGPRGSPADSAAARTTRVAR